MEKRTDRAFFTADLISDIIGRGEGALLHERLIGELGLVSEINAYVSGDRDEGLFIVSGKILEGVDPAVVEEEIWKILNGLKDDLLSEEHLIKAKNKFETAHVYGEISVLNKAMNLCYAELLGSADLVNKELQFYSAVDLASIRNWAKEHFVPEKNNQVVYEKLG